MDKRDVLSLVILRGLPGCGKSTLAEKLKDEKEFIILSKDSFRVDDEGVYCFDPKKEKEIESLFFSDLEKLVNKEANIVVDDLNLSTIKLEMFSRFASSHEITTISFLPDIVEIHALRNTHQINEKEIERMMRYYDPYASLYKNIIIKPERFWDSLDEAMIQLFKITKSDNNELEIRISTVAEMRIKGQNRSDIVHYASKKWHVSSRQVDSYLSSAKQLIKRSVIGEKEDFKELVITRYEDLYKRNFNIQDYRECRQLCESLSKLLGLGEANVETHKIYETELTTEAIEVLMKDRWE